MVLAVAVPTAIQASLGLLPSTSVELRSPVAVGVPGVPLSTPPASTTGPMKSPSDHCSVVPAGDGDGHQLLGVVDRRDGERVGQRLPAIEPLNGGVAVVQRVDPQPGGGERIAAVAIGARCRRADRGPGVVRIVEVGGAQIAGRSGRAGVTVVELARLHHRAGHRAGDVGGVVGAVDGDGHQLLRCRRP